MVVTKDSGPAALNRGDQGLQQKKDRSSPLGKWGFFPVGYAAIIDLTQWASAISLRRWIN